MKEEIIYGLIQNKIKSQSDFINNSLITMIVKYGLHLYNYTDNDKVIEEFISIVFLNESITSTVIEKAYTDTFIMSEFNIKHTQSDLLNKYSGLRGIYFIYNKYDMLIYVGKSINLSERPLVSFINKLPQGASYIKILELGGPELSDSDLTTVETVFIDYYTPLFNTARQVVNLKPKTYANLIVNSPKHMKNKYEPMLNN